MNYKVINFTFNSQFYIAELKLLPNGSFEVVSVHEEHDSIPVPEDKITEDMVIAIQRVLSTSTP